MTIFSHGANQSTDVSNVIFAHPACTSMRAPTELAWPTQVHAAIRENPQAEKKERKKPSETKNWKPVKLTYDERKAALKVLSLPSRCTPPVSLSPAHACSRHAFCGISNVEHLLFSVLQQKLASLQEGGGDDE